MAVEVTEEDAHLIEPNEDGKSAVVTPNGRRRKKKKKRKYNRDRVVIKG